MKAGKLPNVKRVNICCVDTSGVFTRTPTFPGAVKVVCENSRADEGCSHRPLRDNQGLNNPCGESQPQFQSYDSPFPLFLEGDDSSASHTHQELKSKMKEEKAKIKKKRKKKDLREAYLRCFNSTYIT